MSKIAKNWSNIAETVKNGLKKIENWQLIG
jgi:hypothetical protein